MPDTSAIELIARVVRRDTVDWTGPADPAAAAAFLEAARGHGLHLIVAATLQGAGALGSWPEPIASELARGLRASALVERVRRDEIARVLASLTARGVPALLFKGVPLAYTCYPAPWLRPSVDVDLLVRERDRDEAVRTLELAGYRRTDLVDGSLLMRQGEYTREARGGIRHVVDLHWQMSNAELFSDTLTFDELAAGAVAVPELGGRAFGPPHHLLVTCVHRVAHHAQMPRLVWRYDVHLLAASMDRAALEAFVRLGVDRRVGAICASEVAAAHGLFGTCPAVPVADLIARLRPSSPEPSAAYLRPRRRRILRVLNDLRWQPGWRGKLRFAGQHLFPSPAYMRAAYQGSRVGWLPAQYLHRILTGVARWFRRERA